jgi:hypothetical protein
VSNSTPYCRRFEKIWTTRHDLRAACVLGKPGAFYAFVRAVLRNKTRTHAENDVRRLLAARIKGYDLIRLIGEISCSERHRTHPL